MGMDEVDLSQNPFYNPDEDKEESPLALPRSWRRMTVEPGM
jgi:hypothetical protein